VSAPGPAPVPRVAVVGFGELGEALLRSVAGRVAEAPQVLGRRGRDDAGWRSRVSAAGGAPAASAPEALGDAELVLVCVPGTAALELAEQAAGSLSPGTVWADLSSASPDAKAAAAAVLSLRGARYADAAVLGAVAASGGAVPVLACGDGARALAAAAADLGLDVSAFDGPAGAAARVKLLRSVYMKGRDALVAEMVLAADRYGVADIVTASIRGPGEEVRFPQLVERVLGSLGRHAGRRADELAAAAGLLRSAGVEPAATDGAERRLRLLAEGG
jgi:3-hydroxyisobutyrate dehydrogenase-like beta-hydroxyacid dehydrogenase